MQYTGVHLVTIDLDSEVTRSFRVSGDTLTFTQQIQLPAGEIYNIEQTFSKYDN